MRDRELVLPGGRGSGKTHAVMSEIHDLILAGERPKILVVFPDAHYVYWWGREWERRFPFEMPRYTTIQRMDVVRGLRLRHVYVEDIDNVPDGIYNPKVNDLRIATLRDGGTITYTYSPDWPVARPSITKRRVRALPGISQRLQEVKRG